MFKFYKFLIEIILINVFIFGIITIIASKFKLLFNKKSQTNFDKMRFKKKEEPLWPSRAIVFENDKFSVGEMVQTQGKIADKFVFQSVIFFTSLTDFDQRLKFNIYTKDLAEKQKLGITYVKSENFRRKLIKESLSK